jgi:hypothetical protein
VLAITRDGAPLSRLALARLALAASAAGLLLRCGGTTGRESIPADPAGMADATLDDGAEPGDASADAPPFDAGIQYADPARLPHFEAGSDAAADGASASPSAMWPPCACDDPKTLLPDDASFSATPYYPAGSCSAFVWTNSACDNCIRSSGCTFNTGTSGDTPVFPFCCDLPRDAAAPNAVATAGPQQGVLKFDLCINLWNCVRRTTKSSFALAFNNALCGIGVSAGDCEKNPQGACVAEITAAWEDTNISNILGTLYSTVFFPNVGGQGHEISDLVTCSLAAGNCVSCFSVDGGAP